MSIYEITKHGCFNIAKLYFEAHITIEPVFDERLEFAGTIARKHKFKIADLLMKKRKQDTEERSQYDTFMTGHSKNLEDIENNLKNLVKELQENGFQVWRYKVEYTVYDSKHDDFLKLF